MIRRQRFMLFRKGLVVPVPASTWSWLTDVERRKISAHGLTRRQCAQLAAHDRKRNGEAEYLLMGHDTFLHAELKTDWPTDDR